MTTIHVQRIGDNVLLPHGELDQLVEIARRSEDIQLQMREEDDSTWSMLRLAEQSGAFDFWRDDGESVYTAEDGESL